MKSELGYEALKQSDIYMKCHDVRLYDLVFFELDHVGLYTSVTWQFVEILDSAVMWLAGQENHTTSVGIDLSDCESHLWKMVDLIAEGNTKFLKAAIQNYLDLFPVRTAVPVTVGKPVDKTEEASVAVSGAWRKVENFNGNKTVDQLLALVSSWQSDPYWDIEETEGFEEYYVVLKAYRLARENMLEVKQEIELQQYANALGIPDNLALAAYLNRLIGRVVKLEKLEHER